MLKLGDKARDSVTGFEGTVVARAEYLNGCVRLALVPSVDKGGNCRESSWFDEQRLDSSSTAKTGGPRTAPPVKNPPRV